MSIPSTGTGTTYRRPLLELYDVLYYTDPAWLSCFAPSHPHNQSSVLAPTNCSFSQGDGPRTPVARRLAETAGANRSAECHSLLHRTHIFQYLSTRGFLALFPSCTVGKRSSRGNLQWWYRREIQPVKAPPFPLEFCVICRS